MTFTPQQHQAIFDHQHNLVVVAGAGSGKTRVLVERYIALLESNPDWVLSVIVAVTFTREAALEMRNRVRSTLENRLRDAQSPQERSRWSALLSSMDSARIDTIHGLCTTILRANAAQAGIDPGFAILEPADQRTLLDDVIDRQLRLAADTADPLVLKLFQTYDDRKIRDELKKSDIVSIRLPDPLPDAAGIGQFIRGIRTARIHDARLRLLGDHAFHEALVWQPPGGFPYASEDKLLIPWGEIHRIIPGLQLEDPEAFLDALIALSQVKKQSSSGRAEAWGGAEIRDESRQMIRNIVDRAAAAVKAVGLFDAAAETLAAEHLAGWYLLIQAVQRDYQHTKLNSGSLDFDDLERLTAQLLEQHPEVRARYQDAAIKWLLVDEFQDTNKEQWEIVRALGGPDLYATLFVVGDPKQSIYGFRGADVRVFNKVRDQIRSSGNGAEIPLAQSFRSHPGLIDFFNHVFDRILQPDPDSMAASYQVTYEPMQPFREPLAQQVLDHYAPVELLLLRNIRPDDTKIGAEERRYWEADEIARRIRQLVTDQAPVFDRESGERRCSYGDFAILFRSMTHIAIYEKMLRAQGIPYITVAGRGYYNRQEIWDILNLLKALHNPGDNLALAAALRSPLFAFSDDMLLALRLAQTGDNRTWLWDALADPVPLLTAAENERVQFAHAVLHDLRRLAGRTTVAELLRMALARTGYLAAVNALPGGQRMRANVQKLVDTAEQSGKISLSAFVRHTASLSAAEIREGEAPLEATDVVKLMTIHGSKGLEFPVVFLADASSDRGRSDSGLLLYDESLSTLSCKIYSEEQQKDVASYLYQISTDIRKAREEAESLRLLYVAATRAQDSLIISGELSYTKTSGWKSSGWMGLLLDALDLVTGGDYKPIDGDQVQITPQSFVQIRVPEYDEKRLRDQLYRDTALRWEAPQLPAETGIPPLLQPMPSHQEQWIGHLAATQLADLGGLHHAGEEFERIYYRNNLRRQIFDDFSARSGYAAPAGEPRIRMRQVGEVVHEALRYWRFDRNPDQLDKLLSSYAWQQGITDLEDTEVVLRRAKELLNRFRASAIYREMLQVRQMNLPFLSEIPFIYRTEKRIIHGVIDLLYQRPDGKWFLLDYKTSTVRSRESGRKLPSAAEIADHARRYYLQVGMYAAAAQHELNGIVPDVAIYYIQYNQLVEIPAAAWQAEIHQLEQYIGEMLRDVTTTAR